MTVESVSVPRFWTKQWRKNVRSRCLCSTLLHKRKKKRSWHTHSILLTSRLEMDQALLVKIESNITINDYQWEMLLFPITLQTIINKQNLKLTISKNEENNGNDWSISKLESFLEKRNVTKKYRKHSRRTFIWEMESKYSKCSTRIQSYELLGWYTGIGCLTSINIELIQLDFEMLRRYWRIKNLYVLRLKVISNMDLSQEMHI